ncbi:MAG: hypothetical protein QOH49_3958 [Acidobacteriota bacterium]|jgi:hypothetical protein|nr:hypothetical protein [Acidobacteriota bacterium]
MFCPYCGTETTQGLNYCNRCGGNLAPLTQAPAQESRIIVAPGAAWAAGLTTTAVIVIGLGIIFPITSELAMRGVPPIAFVAIALFVALAVVGCAAMLLRFWSLLLGVGAARNNAPTLPQHKAQDTRGLDAPHFDSLNPAPVPSVTEQTTRTLERVKK